MSKITFAILAYNEENRISYAIKNLIRYGEVIILDGGSTDKTKEITESLGAKFISRPENTKSYVETKENLDFLLKLTQNDWIYWGYADNLLPKKLLEKLTEISNQDKIKIVYAPMYTYLWGDTRNYVQKSGIPVLFHKNFISFNNARIHSMGDFTGTKKEKLFLPSIEDYAVKHFSLYNMKKFVTGHLKYAETEAEEKYARGIKFSLIKMFASMLRYMWIYGKCSWKNGSLGFITIFQYAFFRLMTNAKLYELEHSITLENIEEKYRIKKDDILKDFL